MNNCIYTCHMFLYLYLPLIFFKNKQITKNVLLCSILKRTLLTYAFCMYQSNIK